MASGIRKGPRRVRHMLWIRISAGDATTAFIGLEVDDNDDHRLLFLLIVAGSQSSSYFLVSMLLPLTKMTWSKEI